jgi:hypothetical protein
MWFDRHVPLTAGEGEKFVVKRLGEWESREWGVGSGEERQSACCEGAQLPNTMMTIPEELERY